MTRVLHRKKEQRLLEKLQHLGPMIQGSVTTVVVRCGNPRCQCAHGHKHRSVCLSLSRQGKSRMVYLGAALAPTARQWVANYRQLQRWVRQLTDLNIARLIAQRRQLRATRRARADRPKGGRVP